MEESIYQFAEKISKLFQEAYDVYLPLVEDVCSRGVSDFILKHIGRYGKMKINDYSVEFIKKKKQLL